MEAQRWAMIDSLYHAALTKEPGERSSFLAAVCAEDAELQREVESLLAHAGAHFSIPRQRSNMAKLARNIAGDGVSDAGGFRQAMDDGECGRICPQWLGNGVGHCSSDGFGLVEAPPARIARTLPVAIGRYRIVRLLGEGGMGAVYEAEQEHPRRTVALKVIQPGLANPELLWRFEQESQALGRLQHPGIAQIYEAGTADTGFGPQPYFAMEFIRGESLGEYADAHQLNSRQRLAMMTKICEAVRHAHQRGLIHRDLKPGNMIRALPVRKNRFLSRIRTNDPTSKGR